VRTFATGALGRLRPAYITANRRSKSWSAWSRCAFISILARLSTEHCELSLDRIGVAGFSRQKLMS
jgi:hypothetical protein